MTQRIVIAGAAGRDFHDFNVAFRDDPAVEVVAFTATQIPGIAGRTYPAALSGPRYPDGIPIRDAAELEQLVRDEGIDQVVFSYSDVSHDDVMAVAARAIAAGADFRLLGTRRVQLQATCPVVAVCAVRTGCGKSHTTRHVASVLQGLGHRVAVVRHPMPYGDLARQRVQRFATYEDLAAHGCTVEEREEYEPHLAAGLVVYAGVDYGAILAQAQAEADVILWDGGNNDVAFFRPDFQITLVDPLRPGDELGYHPGRANLLLADVVLINKVDVARAEDLETVRANVARLNPEVTVVESVFPVTVPDPAALQGKRVLAVEDGPTLTHGGLGTGAATVAAQQSGATVVDARPFAVGSLAETYARYPHAAPALPAMGYSEGQLHELEATINAADVDAVVVGTPVDLGRLIAIQAPVVRVSYALKVLTSPTLEELIAARFPG